MTPPPGVMNQMAWGIDTPPEAMSEHFDVSMSMNTCSCRLSLMRP
jgi:hypothetical protein